MRFRPCIDLHNGKVKQIVGSSLSDQTNDQLLTNFEADKPAQWFARKYRQDGLSGGHVIQLGPGNHDAAKAALEAWPGGLQIGGGITIDNAGTWLDNGAEAVIVTSWVFHDGRVDTSRLKALTQSIGTDHLVLDLSCRRRGDAYYIVTNRWQTFTEEKITLQLLDDLSEYCFEFLIHAVDVEGKCSGIELPLVEVLGQWGHKPVTYAGGIHNRTDIDLLSENGRDCLDFTVGSALDIFGGSGLTYQELVDDYGPSGDR